MIGAKREKDSIHSTTEKSQAAVYPPISPEVLREIRRISFLARKRASQGLFGKYKSAFKGTGIEFEELRAYVPGDDVRSIHWGATARSLIPQIKRYREERELQVLLAIDVSASHASGTGGQLRQELLAQIAATLACIALTNNDKIGLLTFSNQVESYTPPRKSRGSTWRLIHEILYPNTKHRRATSITKMCEFLNSILKRRTIVFLISDFLDTGFEHSLAILARRHDVSAFIIQDPCEENLPQVGLLRMYNPETGENILFDTNDSLERELYFRRNKEFRDKQKQLFAQMRIPSVSFFTNEAFTQKLRSFFDEKGRR